MDNSFYVNSGLESMLGKIRKQGAHEMKQKLAIGSGKLLTIVLQLPGDLCKRIHVIENSHSFPISDRLSLKYSHVSS